MYDIVRLSLKSVSMASMQEKRLNFQHNFKVSIVPIIVAFQGIPKY